MGAVEASVVVPLYNHESYVVEALQSLADQTCAGRLEVVVIDDASSDGSYRVASDFMATVADRFARAEVRQNAANRGAPGTLNNGVASSSGKTLFFLNSDDAFAPKRVEAMLAALDREDAGFGFSEVEAFGDRTRVAEFNGEIAAYLARIDAEMPSIEFGFLAKNLAISTGNIVARRSLWETLGGFGPFAFCHDWDFALEAISVSRPAFVREPLYRYRLHPHNASLGLEDMADLESDWVLQKYFGRCLRNAVRNEMAPSPLHWPGVFENHLKDFRIEGLHDRWLAAAHHHHPVFRTSVREDIYGPPARR